MPPALAFDFIGAKAVMGKRLPPHGYDPYVWATAVREGLPIAAFASLAQNLGLPQATLAKSLGLSERTLARRKKEVLLSPQESERLVRLAQIAERATQVLGSSAKAIRWLQTPNFSLDNQTPLSQLDVEQGGEVVLNILGRIEHGIFA